jgi:hypothetical protein
MKFRDQYIAAVKFNAALKKKELLEEEKKRKQEAKERVDVKLANVVRKSNGTRLVSCFYLLI